MEFREGAFDFQTSQQNQIVYTVEDADEQNITLPVFNYWETVVKVNGKKSTIENDNGLVSIKSTGKRTIVEVSSTYPTTMILSLLISSITFIFLFTRYLIRCCG